MKETPAELYRKAIAGIDAYCRQHFGGKPYADLDEKEHRGRRATWAEPGGKKAIPSRGRIALLRLIGLVSVITLAVLFILAGADFITRGIERAPWQPAQPSVVAEHKLKAR